MRKYEFTGEVKEYLDVTLHRIRALIDFNDVEKGELGGFIEKEYNLSHSGDAWVYDNSRVAENARVAGNARVIGNACVVGDAYLAGDSWVADDAYVAGDTRLDGNSFVADDAMVYGEVRLDGATSLYANADIFRTTQYLNIGPIGGRFDFTTFYRDTESGIMVSCGCFLGKLEEFKEKVK